MHGMGALLACGDLRARLQPRILIWLFETGMDGAHAMQASCSQAVEHAVTNSSLASGGNGRALAHHITVVFILFQADLHINKAQCRIYAIACLLCSIASESALPAQQSLNAAGSQRKLRLRTSHHLRHPTLQASHPSAEA